MQKQDNLTCQCLAVIHYTVDPTKLIRLFYTTRNPVHQIPKNRKKKKRIQNYYKRKIENVNQNIPTDAVSPKSSCYAKETQNTILLTE